MARTIDETTEVTEVATTVANRTWRVEVFCERDRASYEIVFHREQVKTVNGVVSSVTPLPAIRKNLNDVLSEEITAAGATVTVGQLTALVSAVGDNWEAAAEPAE